MFKSILSAFDIKTFFENPIALYATIGILALLIILLICDIFGKSKKKKSKAEIIENKDSKVLKLDENSEIKIEKKSKIEPLIIPEKQTNKVAIKENSTVSQMEVIEIIEEKPVKVIEEEIVEKEQPVKVELKIEVVEPIVEDVKSVLKPMLAPKAKKQPVKKEEKSVKEVVAKKETASSEDGIYRKPIIEDFVDDDDDDENAPKVTGKFKIEKSTELFQFSLYANNGQLLYESREYATEASCKKGVETFVKNVAECKYRVAVDKNGGHKYIFRKGNSIYIGESFSTAKAAERSAESVIKFAAISAIVE